MTDQQRPLERVIEGETNSETYSHVRIGPDGVDAEGRGHIRLEDEVSDAPALDSGRPDTR